MPIYTTWPSNGVFILKEERTGLSLGISNISLAFQGMCISFCLFHLMARLQYHSEKRYNNLNCFCTFSMTIDKSPHLAWTRRAQQNEGYQVSDKPPTQSM